MPTTALLFAALAGDAGAIGNSVENSADVAPIHCHSCEDWNARRKPFRVYGDTYYVGTEGLSAVLIATPKGLMLIDGALPQSAPVIAENILSLGYRIEDLKWIVVSHAHYDHAGGIAALQRMSGAQVAASIGNAAGLRAGNATPDDPQAGFGEEMRFPAVADVVELADGASLVLGDVKLTAHYTPGHTPGSTSWSWRSCAQGRCKDLVYADSLNPVSAPGFRYSASAERVAAFERSIATVRALPCDALVSAHPGFSNLFDKLEARERDPDHDALLAPGACREYADDADARLKKRLAEEAAQAPASSP